MRRLNACVLMLCLVTVTEVYAQKAEEHLLRTYEVGDLTLNVNDRPLTESLKSQSSKKRGTLGGGGGGAFSIGHQAMKTNIRFAQFSDGVQEANNETKVTIGDLIDAIITAVAPETWAENGGGDGIITRVGTSLVVWQTPQTHQQVAGLLDALRSDISNRGTLRIDARWLRITSDELARLYAGDGKELNRTALDRLTRQSNSVRGITNCMNGQLVHLVSGTRQNMVESYTPVVGSLAPADSQKTQFASYQNNGVKQPTIHRVAESSDTAFLARSGVGYQPVMKMANFGTLLEIRPTLTPDAKQVTIDLYSSVTLPSRAMDGTSPTLRSAIGAPSVDRVAIETQQFATTLRIPVGKPFLVGGMTDSPASRSVGDDQGNAQEKPQLYLVLELR